VSTDTWQPTFTAVIWIPILLGKYSSYLTNNANPIHSIGLTSQLPFLAAAQWCDMEIVKGFSCACIRMGCDSVGGYRRVTVSVDTAVWQCRWIPPCDSVGGYRRVTVSVDNAVWQCRSGLNLPATCFSERFYSRQDQTVSQPSRPRSENVLENSVITRVSSVGWVCGSEVGEIQWICLL